MQTPAALGYLFGSMMKSICAGVAAIVVTGVSMAHAAPPAPTGAHPRLFLDDATLAAMRQAANDPNSAVAHALSICDDVIANPSKWSSGGYQGIGFPAPFGACSVAWVVRGDDASGAAAVKYFNALLDDYGSVGDGAGGDAVVRHDSGYSMRVFAPYAAIGYDWLQNAPGVDGALLAHARARFKAWTDWYAQSGYHADQAGANYHAGYVVGATLIAIAEAGEAGADGDALWTHVVDDIFGTTMAEAIAPGGVLDGGDWLEGWQYGPLSVAEYAMAASALHDNGVALDGYADWKGALVTRSIYATVPDESGAFIGGDSENSKPYSAVAALTLYASMLGDAPTESKAWAYDLIQRRDLRSSTFPLVGAIAEAGAPAPQPFPTDTASTWYYTAGSQTVHTRTNWSADAVWMVNRCAPHRVDDHMFIDAGNLVLTRGSDDLIVDPSPYGSLSTLTGNAPTVASPQLPGSYQPSQAVWGDTSGVGYTWMRQTQSGVFATRCEYAGQYTFQDRASDIPSAVRDTILVPYGQGDAALVVIDDVRGAATDRPLNLRFHAPTGFTMSGDTARANVGGSDLIVQAPFATAGSPSTMTPAVGDCSSAARGQCEIGRFDSGEWRLEVPAAHPQAITVLDAVAAGETPAPATASSGQGWRATELDRDVEHIAVVAVDPGLSSVTYTAAPGGHVVVGAPQSATGRADVTAAPSAAGCDMTITPHSGDGGFDARPLVIAVDADCTVTEDPPSDGFTSPGGTDTPPGGGGNNGNNDLTSGCQAVAGAPSALALSLILLALGLAARRRRRVRR